MKCKHIDANFSFEIACTTINERPHRKKVILVSSDPIHTIYLKIKKNSNAWSTICKNSKEIRTLNAYRFELREITDQIECEKSLNVISCMFSTVTTTTTKYQKKEKKLNMC